MNFNDLKIFIVVYEKGSINKAAAQLQYAQSNISQRINNIENELGVKLLIRNSKGIQANKYGEKFYLYSLKVLNDTENMKSQLHKNVTSMLCSELLFSYLTDIKQLNMNWNIDISTTGNINSNIEKKNYDIVIVFNKFSTPRYILKGVQSIELKFYGSNLLPLLVNKDPHCPLRKLSLELVANNQKVLELNSLEGIINLVESGKGRALLPKFFEKRREIVCSNPKTYELDYYTYQLRV